MKKVVVTDYQFDNLDIEAGILKAEGNCELFAPPHQSNAC